MSLRRAGHRLVSLLGASAAFLGVTAPLSAWASEPEPVGLSWVRGQGADSCSSLRDASAQIAERLGKNPFAADAARTIDVTLNRSSDVWRAEIYVRDRSGKLTGARELTSDAPGCAAIESAVVLAVALTIDPELGTRPPSPPRTPPPVPPAPLVPAPPASAPPTASAPPPPAPPTRSPEAASGERRSSGLALGVGAGFGLLPKPGVGLSLSASTPLASPLDLTADALWMPETHASDARISFGLTALSVGLCAGFLSRARVSFAACASVWGGSLHAVVTGLRAVEPGDRAWAAVSGAPRLHVRLWPRVYLELGAQMFVPLVRRPFLVTGRPEPVFQEPSVAALPFAGVGVNFP